MGVIVVLASICWFAAAAYAELRVSPLVCFCSRSSNDAAELKLYERNASESFPSSPLFFLVGNKRRFLR